MQQLNRTGTTTGKKPASITAYNNSMHALQAELTSAKNSANAIIQEANKISARGTNSINKCKSC